MKIAAGLDWYLLILINCPDNQGLIIQIMNNLFLPIQKKL